MINIVERPSKSGKLIHLNPQDWNTAARIRKALSKEEHATEEHGQYDTPDNYPIGTVAELRATEFGVTYYLIKQANGSWRQITPTVHQLRRPIPGKPQRHPLHPHHPLQPR